MKNIFNPNFRKVDSRKVKDAAGNIVVTTPWELDRQAFASVYLDEGTNVDEFFEAEDGQLEEMLFGGDPDYLHLDGEHFVFTTFEADGTTYIVYEGDDDTGKIASILTTFIEQINAGAVTGDLFGDMENTWEAFKAADNAIAYRGGSGYGYMIVSFDPDDF